AQEKELRHVRVSEYDAAAVDHNTAARNRLKRPAAKCRALYVNQRRAGLGIERFAGELGRSRSLRRRSWGYVYLSGDGELLLRPGARFLSGKFRRRFGCTCGS